MKHKVDAQQCVNRGSHWWTKAEALKANGKAAKKKTPAKKKPAAKKKAAPKKKPAKKKRK